MAPYSPAIGLSLAHESQAPPPPKLSTKLLSSLVTHPHPSTSKATSSTKELQLQPRKLMYSPHIPNSHGRRSLPNGESTGGRWPGLSTVILSVLLVMLIGASTSGFSYEKQGREQSVVEMVKDAYFDQGVSVPLNERAIVQARSVYLVKELEVDMTLDMKRRDGEPTSSIAPPLASPSVKVTSSANTTPTSSSTRSAPSAAKSEFKEADDVRDPTAVKPSSDESMASVDSDPTEAPSKRHWSSRYRRVSLGRRAY